MKTPTILTPTILTLTLLTCVSEWPGLRLTLGVWGRVLVYIRCLGDLLITTQAEQSVRPELRRENCKEVRG